MLIGCTDYALLITGEHRVQPRMSILGPANCPTVIKKSKKSHIYNVLTKLTGKPINPQTCHCLTAFQLQ